MGEVLESKTVAANHRERRVLLIEPQARDRDAMAGAILSQSPLYDVDQVESLQQAMTMLDSRSFDVIVVDNELPDAQGETLVRSLVKKAPYSPIIVVTANDSPELALLLLASGASDFLPKFGEYQKFLPRMLTTNLQRAIIIENLKEMYDRVEHSK